MHYNSSGCFKNRGSFGRSSGRAPANWNSGTPGPRPHHRSRPVGPAVFPPPVSFRCGCRPWRRCSVLTELDGTAVSQAATLQIKIAREHRVLFSLRHFAPPREPTGSRAQPSHPALCNTSCFNASKYELGCDCRFAALEGSDIFRALSSSQSRSGANPTCCFEV